MLMAAALAAPALPAFSAGETPAAPTKAAKPDLVKGEASYAAVCVACHGADGNSAIPVNPKLSQQHPEYLVKQLQEYKSGKRENAIMKGFASALSDEDMVNIAFWLASQKAMLTMSSSDKAEAKPFMIAFSRLPDLYSCNCLTRYSGCCCDSFGLTGMAELPSAPWHATHTAA